MATLKRDTVVVITLSTLIVIVLSYLALNSPIEKMLSHSGYPWIREYPWYLYWRIALANLIIWLVALVLLSFELKWAKYLALLSAITFTLFHYITLMVSGRKEYVVKIMPLVYTVYSNKYQCETSYLDLGQIIILITLLNTVNWKDLIKRKIK